MVRINSTTELSLVSLLLSISSKKNDYAVAINIPILIQIEIFKSTIARVI